MKLSKNLPLVVLLIIFEFKPKCTQVGKVIIDIFKNLKPENIIVKIVEIQC